MIKRYFNVFLLLTTVVIGLSAYILAWITLTPGPLKENKIIVINRGSLFNVAKQLDEQNVITNKLPFVLLAKLANYVEHLKAGEYPVAAGSSSWDIIRLMQSGAFFKRSITIPEGFTTGQILALVDQNIHLIGPKHKDQHGEGDFLPETYFFIHGEKKLDLLNRMSSSMKQAVDEVWAQRNINIPLKTKEELLILASIIEKEAKINEEQPVIASVFINRLTRKMKLESDPTTIYSITKGKYILARPITRKDLQTPSSFNTYYVQGLPPTPIANPGLSAIKAAANPANTKYLFFVVKDCQGRHNFSSTLKEHTTYVSQYRKLNCES
jgi:UPF0755 protein